MSPTTTDRYVPAAGLRGFTAAYDKILALTMREGAWRPPLVEAICTGLPDGATVADVGAGTGTLAIALAAARPDLQVIAIDGDPEVRRIAQRKPGAGAVTWRQGLAGELPLEDASVDRVVLSLLLHHLARDAKRTALAEARRVLRPGGVLHVADWGRPPNLPMRVAFLALQLVDGFPNTRDHAAGRLPGFLTDADFADVQTVRRLSTGWGSLELLRANRT